MACAMYTDLIQGSRLLCVDKIQKIYSVIPCEDCVPFYTQTYWLTFVSKNAIVLCGAWHWYVPKSWKRSFRPYIWLHRGHNHARHFFFSNNADKSTWPNELWKLSWMNVRFASIFQIHRKREIWRFWPPKINYGTKILFFSIWGSIPIPVCGMVFTCETCCLWENR